LEKGYECDIFKMNEPISMQIGTNAIRAWNDFSDQGVKG